MPRRDVRADAGSATVLALGVIAVLLMVTLAGLAVLSAVQAVHAARSVADLAALAGAAHYQEQLDPGPACEESRRIASRHGARLIGCEIGGGGDATVTTSVTIRHRLAGVGPDRAEGRARAGPSPAE